MRILQVLLSATALLAFAAVASAQTSLQLRWELEEDVFRDARDAGASRVAFALTNRDAKPLPARGWAIYFSALHEPLPGTLRGGVAIERVSGEVQRIVPGAGFPGLAPGGAARFEYLTSLLTNRSFAPVGPSPVGGSDRCLTQRPESPEAMVGHDERHVRSTFQTAGLQIEEPVRYGAWCARAGYTSYQDIVVATRTAGRPA